MKRRQMLRLAGTGFVVALPGCSGNESGEDGSNPESESRQGTQTTTTKPTKGEETTETDTERTTASSGSSGEGYPTQESSGFQEDLDQIVNNVGVWAIKIDDYSFLNVPSLSQGLQENWGSNSGVRSAGWTYREALYMAVNGESAGEGSDAIYMQISSIEGIPDRGVPPGAIRFYVNPSLGDNYSDVTSSVGVAQESYQDGEIVEISREVAREAYSEFFSEHIDGDGVTHHTGEIPEYARDALESGWQAG